MITVLISDEYLALINQQSIEEAAQKVMDILPGNNESDISIAIDGDERIRQLNFDFLGIDAPTDVLSFPSGGDEVDPESGHAYLGDLIISYPRALLQAQAAGHAVENEILLLIVHGILHLLGYDHATPEDKEEMWRIQGEILNKLGIQINKLPET